MNIFKFIIKHIAPIRLNFVERPLEEIIAEEHEIEKDLLFVLSKNMPIDYAV